MRIAFLAGAQHLFASIMDPAEKEWCCMSLIQSNLDAFRRNGGVTNEGWSGCEAHSVLQWPLPAWP